MAETGPPLGKYLASTDKKTRDKAIKHLSTFFESSEDALPKKEMDKLWKGIFYCFWMSDKPLVQQGLASELAELIVTITSPSNSLGFLRGFWESIVREWNNIDRLRIDKYYILVRRFVNASFRFLIKADWNAQVCEEYNAILTSTGGPLCPDDVRVPRSLAYHVVDIYLEELDRAVSATNPSLPTPLGTLLQPFILLAARTLSSVTYKRLESSLFHPLLHALSPPSGEDEAPRTKRIRLSADPTYPSLCSKMCFEEASNQKTLDRVTVKTKILKSIFEIASQPESQDSSRRRMYALWRSNNDDADDDV